MVQPTFIGLGAQKCASSWIHRVLGDHPEIFASEPKELDFFSHHYNRGYSWYEHCFEPGAGARARGEISPSYFCDPLAPTRVRDYDPALKLVLALRDPVSRAFSNHLHEIRKGFYHCPDLRFESGLARNPMYVFQSRYGSHLEAWTRAFPLSRILILVQEEIHTDPLGQARRLYSFLGVDPAHRSRFLFGRSHESVGSHHEGLFRAWRKVGDFGRRRGWGRAIEAIKRFPPVAATMAANRRDLRAEIPPMRAETEQALRDLLAPEMAKLAALTGRQDWPWPTFGAALARRDAAAAPPPLSAASG